MPNTPPAARQPSSRMVRVIVVDDEPTARLSIRRVLTAQAPNVEVIEAANGLDALELILNRLPDLVVVDLNMPVVSGLELLELLRGNPSAARMPVIVVTGSSAEAEIVHAIELGVWDYLLKPVHSELAAGRLRHAVESVASRHYYNLKGPRDGSKVLIADVDTDFDRFIVKALEPSFVATIAVSAAQAVTAALKQHPDVAILSTDIADRVETALDRVLKPEERRPMILRLVDSEEDLGPGRLLRRYDPGYISAAVVRALCGLPGEVKPFPGDDSLAFIADRALLLFFATATGEIPEDVGTAADAPADITAWVDLTEPNKGVVVRCAVESTRALAADLVAVLAGGEAEPENEEQTVSSLRELVNVVGSRVKNFAVQQQLHLQGGLPLATGIRPLDPGEKLHGTSRRYRWRGSELQAACEVFQTVGESERSIQPPPTTLSPS